MSRRFLPQIAVERSGLMQMEFIAPALFPPNGRTGQAVGWGGCGALAVNYDNNNLPLLRIISGVHLHFSINCPWRPFNLLNPR